MLMATYTLKTAKIIKGDIMLNNVYVCVKFPTNNRQNSMTSN